MIDFSPYINKSLRVLLEFLAIYDTDIMTSQAVNINFIKLHTHILHQGINKFKAMPSGIWKQAIIHYHSYRLGIYNICVLMNDSNFTKSGM